MWPLVPVVGYGQLDPYLSLSASCFNGQLIGISLNKLRLSSFMSNEALFTSSELSLLQA